MLLKFTGVASIHKGSPLSMDLQLRGLFQLQVLLLGACVFSLVLPHDGADNGGVCAEGCR
eukprot:4596200-Amphidinium_carterae.1